MQPIESIRRKYDSLYQRLRQISDKHADLQKKDDRQQKEEQARLAEAEAKLQEFHRKWESFYQWAKVSLAQYGPRKREYQLLSYTPEAMRNEIQGLMSQAARHGDPGNRSYHNEIVAGALEASLTYLAQTEQQLQQEVRFAQHAHVSLAPRDGGANFSSLAGEIGELFRQCREWKDACGDPTLDVLPLFGFQAMPFPVLKGDRPRLPKNGDSSWPFDTGEENEGMVYLPVSLPRLAYFACRSRKNAGIAASNFLRYAVNQLQIHTREESQAHWRTVILDTTTLYDSSIGALAALKGDCTSAYAAPACHSLSEANTTLDELWSLAHTEEAERLLIIRCSLGEIEENRVRRLVNNAEELHLTVIIIDETTETAVPSYMRTGNAAVYLDRGEYFTLEGAGRFEPFCPETEFTARQAERIRERLGRKEIYEYPMIDFARVGYHLGDRDMKLPYGVTEDNAEYVYNTQDNETKKGGGGNAGFLVGVSGSGKSTLIHNLIASLILRYHPDDVELWLADFKMKEFAHYAEHWPPHVRYILLDESADMVCSLVDKLTEEMKRRQRIIASFGASWYQDPKIRPRLPLLFVIIDEFSRMSQALKDAPEYKTKLQNIFTQARDQGIRLLMSSQFYRNGVEALNEQAKGQIGIRLAMCTTDKGEMKDTLAIPQELMTDAQKATISTLPRYKVLAYEDNTLKKINVYNLSLKAREQLDRVIDDLESNMIPVESAEELSGNDPMQYVRKERLLVSGDPAKLDTFEACRPSFLKELSAHKAAKEKGAWFWLGRARRLEATSSIRLLKADSENLLICANPREEEQQDGMISIVRSLILSAGMQDIDVQIWIKEPTEEMLRQWDGTRILTEDEQIEAEARKQDRLLDEGKTGKRREQLLILADPAELAGSRKMRELKDRLRPKKQQPEPEKTSEKEGEVRPAGGTAASGGARERFEKNCGFLDARKKEQDTRTLEDRIRYFIAAGPEQGLHVAAIVPTVRPLIRSGILPEADGFRSNKLMMFRHQIAFRMSEDDEECALKYPSRRQLNDTLAGCFLYRDGIRMVMREPYRTR